VSTKNPSLGHIDCPTCGAAGADVRQTKRRGAHLYWQCHDCGLMQPTGAAIQSRIWRQTTWAQDAKPTRPGNVTEGTEEFDPETDPETDPGTGPRADNQPTANRPSASRGVGVLLLGAMAMAALLSLQ